MTKKKDSESEAEGEPLNPDEDGIAKDEVSFVPAQQTISNPDDGSPSVENTPQSAEAMQSQPESGYITNQWMQLDHFECVYCPFDTLNELEMKAHQDHMHRYHPPQMQAINFSVPFYDRYGNLVGGVQPQNEGSNS